MSNLKSVMMDVDDDIINMMNVGMAPDEIEEAIEMTHGTFWVGRVEEILNENVSD
jgi:hypothetical protein